MKPSPLFIAFTFPRVYAYRDLRNLKNTTLHFCTARLVPGFMALVEGFTPVLVAA